MTARLGVEGVMLLKVEPDSAVALAGLHGTRADVDGSVSAGDIVQSINGDSVTLHIWHAGKELDVDVVLQGE